MPQGLMIRVEGVVSMKKITTYQGESKARVEVQFMGGTISCVVPREKYAEMPEEGQPLVLLMTAKCEMGEFGASLKQMKYVGHEGSASAAGSARAGLSEPPMRRAA